MASSRPQAQSQSSASSQYQHLRSYLLSQPHKFISLPTSPLPLLIPQSQPQTPPSSATRPTSTPLPPPPPPPPPVASLSLHPTLEATLHLLNRDLPSAHFLLRHSQAAPDYPSMYLHGILHRIEGDVDNTRIWYSQVEGADEPEADVLKKVWGGKTENEEGKGWRRFLDRVERWRDRVGKKDGAKKSGGLEEAGVDWEQEEHELNEVSIWELRTVLDICEKEFGTSEMLDASSEYTLNGDKGEKAANMVTGGEGWREF